MDPVYLALAAIQKIVKAIANAAAKVRRNKADCKELATRVHDVARLLPEYKAVATRDAEAARILRRLKAVLTDGLDLVKSCRRRRRSVAGCLIMLVIDSGGVAAKFKKVNAKIDSCLTELQTANGIRMEKKIRYIARLLLAFLRGGRHHNRRSNNPGNLRREINAGKNGSNKGGRNNGGKQNGGKGGNRSRGKKAADPQGQRPQYHRRRVHSAA
uniref:DUF7792 domain-containing protein n=1 Tax=Leersia perrieri TaxID=77586 RepID=A0A0D9XV09_9ORYZ